MLVRDKTMAHSLNSPFSKIDAAARIAGRLVQHRNLSQRAVGPQLNVIPTHGEHFARPRDNDGSDHHVQFDEP